MRIDELDYNLPEELIAQVPVEPRDHSRLLVVDRQTGNLTDRNFYDLPEYLRKGDVLVVNDTRVVSARLFFRKSTGGKIEGLFVRQLKDDEWEMMIKGISKLKPGAELVLEESDSDVKFQFIERLSDKTVRVKLSRAVGVVEFLDKFGHVPLPPYIRRNDRSEDKFRYQTVFSQMPGAIAAPTAGLHFTEKLIETIKALGVDIVSVTLHVGIGTFEPIQSEDVSQHKMHSEYFTVSERAADVINRKKEQGGRIIAVGTTSVRVLESAVDNAGRLQSCSGQTDIFIYPPYEFKLVDCLITNFHLPKTTLLAMIFAFAGRDLIMKAYEYAISQRYRFYSYGDGMLII